jgi:hypothetical protein
MTPDEKIDPAPVADAPAADASTAPPLDEFDPRTWVVPLVCKDCGKDFSAPYRHVQAGVVFHCPHCRGSFVPTTTIDRQVHGAFEEFYAARRRARDEFAHRGGDAAALAAQQARELEQFRARLNQLAHAMSPAGKLIRRKGLGAMFS